MAAARIENRRNQLEKFLQKPNEFWIRPHSECVLRPGGGCLNQRPGLMLVSLTPKSVRGNGTEPSRVASNWSSETSPHFKTTALNKLIFILITFQLGRLNRSLCLHVFWRLEIVTQNEESTGSSMLLGMTEEEIKEKLRSFSSFLSPNSNVSYKKVKVSLRNKSIIYCQVLACHDSWVRLSQTAHRDFSSSILFCQEAPSSRSPQQLPQNPDRECPGCAPGLAHSDCSRHSLADQPSLQYSLFEWGFCNAGV